jgi:hypothetical protein
MFCVIKSVLRSNIFTVTCTRFISLRMRVIGRRCTCVLLIGVALFRIASFIIYVVPFVWPWVFTTTFLELSLAQTVSYHPYVPP